MGCVVRSAIVAVGMMVITSPCPAQAPNWKVTREDIVVCRQLADIRRLMGVPDDAVMTEFAKMLIAGKCARVPKGSQYVVFGDPAMGFWTMRLRGQADIVWTAADMKD